MVIMDATQTPSVSRLEIHLLGRFAVYIDGEILPEAEIGGRKARTLFKLLAQQRHFQLVRDQALEILWPDLDQEAASAQLYKALHAIRKAFAGPAGSTGEWITMSDDLIRLVPPSGLVTDVQQFEQAVRNGIRGNQISELERAISLYSGDFLPMDRYAEWAAMPREHYRQLYLDALSALADQYEQQGDLSEAAEMHRLALEKEPTLETAHHGLMRIFARKGQPTRAFHQYDQCREVLKEELGMSPSPETRKTLDDIREGRFPGQQQLDTAQESLRGTVPGRADPIIGRNEACAELDRLLFALSEGKGETLVINGEAGTGKTRLVQELAKRSLQKEIPCFMGRTGEGNETMAYGPFIELFTEVLHQRPDLEDAIPLEFGQLVPGFSGEGVAIPHADKLAAKGYLFAQIYRFFIRLTENIPAVVILEDIHAADQGSRELFSYLVRHRSMLPVLLVATRRIELDEPAAGADFLSGLSDQIEKEINLDHLTYEETHKLIHQHDDSAAMPAEVTDRICQLSEGNPLFALELLQHHTGEGLSRPQETGDRSKAGSSQLLNGNIPDTLRQLVDQKLEKLSPVAHHLLYIAAVIGRWVSYELLASVWSDGEKNEEKDLFNALEEVIRARLLEEHGLDYSFRHALVREIIYAGISGARRRTLHELTAQRLAEISGDDDNQPVEQIAYHFLQAGEILRGAMYLVQAGKRAEAAYAHDDALRNYHEACDILGGLEDKEAQNLRCEVLECIGDTYRACGRLEMSYDAYEEAIMLTGAITRSNRNPAELHRKVAVTAILRTEMDRSERYLTKAFELADDHPGMQARLFITQALHWWHLNRLDEAYDIAQKALKRAREAGAKAEASQACEILAMTCLPLGRWEEGLQYEMERQIYGWSPEVAVATDAHLCLWEYHVTGDQPLQQARSFMEQVARQATELGDLRCVAVCHYALGTMHLWRGMRDRAVKDLSSSLELHERVGSPAGMAYSLARKGGLHTMMGATELGWRAVQDGLAYAEQAAVRDHCLQRLYGIGIWNRLEVDDMAQVRELTGKSEKLLDETGACAACALDLYPWLAYYYLRIGEIERAKACDEAVSELASQTGNPIGSAIAAMITSSICVMHQEEQQAQKHKQEAYHYLEEAVPDSSHSPVFHFLSRMTEQQAALHQS